VKRERRYLYLVGGLLSLGLAWHIGAAGVTAQEGEADVIAAGTVRVRRLDLLNASGSNVGHLTANAAGSELRLIGASGQQVMAEATGRSATAQVRRTARVSPSVGLWVDQAGMVLLVRPDSAGSRQIALTQNRLGPALSMEQSDGRAVLLMAGSSASPWGGIRVLKRRTQQLAILGMDDSLGQASLMLRSATGGSTYSWAGGTEEPGVVIRQPPDSRRVRARWPR
jgi:hypothetical protein